jgi:putative endonuclease
MVDARRLFGNSAERRAGQYLKKQGYKILAKQFTTKFGEIDLIARDGDEIVFVEVKARTSDRFGLPEESVTPKKLEKIALVGQEFLQRKRLHDAPFRIDVVAIDGEGLRHLKAVG